MLEAKLKNKVKATESSTSELVKEMQITANQESSEFKQDISFEIKDNVYKCDQCQFTFKRKKNLKKRVNN